MNNRLKQKYFCVNHMNNRLKQVYICRRYVFVLYHMNNRLKQKYFCVNHMNNHLKQVYICRRYVFVLYIDKIISLQQTVIRNNLEVIYKWARRWKAYFSLKIMCREHIYSPDTAGFFCLKRWLIIFRCLMYILITNHLIPN